jgi:hypothetical protein
MAKQLATLAVCDFIQAPSYHSVIFLCGEVMRQKLVGVLWAVTATVVMLQASLADGPPKISHS